MATTKQQILKVLLAHQVGEGFAFDDEVSEGSVTCNCGWEVVLWHVKGSCDCFNDLDDDDYETECSCVHGRKTSRAIKTKSVLSRKTGNAHVARKLARLRGLGALRAFEVLEAHTLARTDHTSDSGYVCTGACSCGFTKTLFSVKGSCTCGEVCSGVCKFSERLHLAFQRSREDDVWRVLTEHVAAEVNGIKELGDVPDTTALLPK